MIRVQQADFDVGAELAVLSAGNRRIGFRHTPHQSDGIGVQHPPDDDIAVALELHQLCVAEFRAHGAFGFIG